MKIFPAKMLLALLVVVQAGLLATAACTWWAARSATLFGSGRWIVGKDTGKYLFYTHDFMVQPLVNGCVDLTSYMGFQEILYYRAEDTTRRLLRLQARATISSGAYLWVELRKHGQRMLGCRFSRRDETLSGFYRYDKSGQLLSHVPFISMLPSGPSDLVIELRLTNGQWEAMADGVTLGCVPDDGPKAGSFGFRGSGWNRRPVTIADIRMTFGDHENPVRTWTEFENFRPRRTSSRAFLLALAVALFVVGLRRWRQVLWSERLLDSSRVAFRVADDAGLVCALAACAIVQWKVAPASGISIPLALLAAELITLIALAICAKRPAPETSPSLFAVRSVAWFGVVLIIIFGLAAWVHGPWLGRAQSTIRALRDNVPLAALLISPDTRRSSPAFEARNFQVAPGRPFFSESSAWREQSMTIEWIMPSNSTFDVVLQQQSFRTRGDPDGEDLPLQRRLLRFSTRAGVSAGLASQTGNCPLPFLPVAGTVRAGETNSLVLTSSHRGIDVSVNGEQTSYPSLEPLGYGETGLLAYEKPVQILRFYVRPGAGAVSSERFLPWAVASIPIGIVVLAWLVLGTGRRTRLMEFAPLMLGALFPLAAFFTVTLLLDTTTLITFARVRSAWFDLALASSAFSCLALPIVFRSRLRWAPLYGNFCIIAGLGALTLFGWDMLPKDHALRLRFSRDASVPGRPDETILDKPGPWYNHNRTIGSSTYIWYQRFGGKSINPVKASGTTRVFVVGGSQAWGSGAASSRETFSEQLEDMLQAEGLPVEIFNAAVNGGGLQQSLNLYRSLLAGFQPDILLADFGLNECSGLRQLKTEDEMRRHIGLQAGFLRDLLDSCAADGVKVLLVLEPMCGETPLQPVDAFYKQLAHVARERDVPVLNPASLLREKECDHFVWWDTAHLAPCGQRMMAGFIKPELERMIVGTRR